VREREREREIGKIWRGSVRIRIMGLSLKEKGLFLSTLETLTNFRKCPVDGDFVHVFLFVCVCVCVFKGDDGRVREKRGKENKTGKDHEFSWKFFQCQNEKL